MNNLKGQGHSFYYIKMNIIFIHKNEYHFYTIKMIHPKNDYHFFSNFPQKIIMTN